MTGPLATDRLLLEPLRQDDAEDLFQLRGDAEVMQFWDWPPDQNEATTAAVVAQMLGDVAEGGAHFYVLRRRDDGACIGLVDVSGLSNATADVGFMLARAHWGQGYAREALQSLIAFARKLKLPRLTARIHDGNIRSAQLLTALGFAPDAEARPIEVRAGEFRRCRFFRLDLA